MRRAFTSYVHQAKTSSNTNSSGLYTNRIYNSVLSLVFGFAGIVPIVALLSTPPQLESILPSDYSIQQWFSQWKKRTIGRYENRIRSFSHPFKVFQYFASVRKNGTDYMTPDAFIRSLQPYIECTDDSVPSDQHEYRKLKTRSANEFFKLADTDGDGLIDFKEYMFFVTLIMIPSHQFEAVFHSLDMDQNDRLSSSEFHQLVHPEYESTAYFNRMGRREFQSISSHQSHGINRLFFGKDGHGSVNLLEFLGFMHQLRYQVLKLEFYQNRPVDNSISMTDLLTLLIGYTESHVIDKCMYKLNAGPVPSYFHKDRVSFSDFVQVHFVLGHFEDVHSILPPPPNSGPLLVTRDQLLDAFQSASGCQLNPSIIDGLIFLLNKDSDPNVVDYDLFKKVLGHRTSMGLDIPRDIGFGRWLTNKVKRTNS